MRHCSHATPSNARCATGGVSVGRCSRAGRARSWLCARGAYVLDGVGGRAGARGGCASSSGSRAARCLHVWRRRTRSRVGWPRYVARSRSGGIVATWWHESSTLHVSAGSAVFAGNGVGGTDMPPPPSPLYAPPPSPCGGLQPLRRRCRRGGTWQLWSGWAHGRRGYRLGCVGALCAGDGRQERSRDGRRCSGHDRWRRL